MRKNVNEQFVHARRDKECPRAVHFFLRHVPTVRRHRFNAKPVLPLFVLNLQFACPMSSIPLRSSPRLFRDRSRSEEEREAEKRVKLLVRPRYAKIGQHSHSQSYYRFRLSYFVFTSNVLTYTKRHIVKISAVISRMYTVV